MNSYLSLQRKQSQALQVLPIFSGPLIIVITLLGASFYPLRGVALDTAFELRL